MSPGVRFYHNAREPLAIGCELVARAYASGRRIAVRLADAERARDFDRLLWTFSPQIFIPHVLHDSALAGETPVIIGSAEIAPQWPHHDTLFNFAADLAPDYTAFRLVVEIIGQSEAERLPARNRWMHYRQAGLTLKAFDAESRTAL